MLFGWEHVEGWLGFSILRPQSRSHGCRMYVFYIFGLFDYFS
jgi:hypothetical protein